MTIGARRALDGVQRAWDQRIVPALVDYVRIPAQSPPVDPRDRRVDLLVLFALALLPRLVGVAVFHTIPVSDAEAYDRLARLLASGERVFDTYRTPGYVMFLALCYRLLGPGLVPAQIVQAVVGSIGVLLVYLLALRLTTRPIAFTAGILAATHLGLVVFTTELLSETLFVTLLALLLFLLATGSHRSLPGSVLCGVTFGITALVRPSVLYFIVPVLGIAFVGAERRHVWIRAAAFAVSVELTFLPQQVYQYQQWRHLVVLDLNSGVNFYIGNHPGASGRYDLAGDWKDRVPFVGRNGYERDRVAFVEGLRFVTEHPLRAAALTLRKGLQFWTEAFYTNGLVAPRWLVVLDRWQWRLLVVLGAAGTLVTLRAPPFRLLHLCVLYFWGVHALTFNDYRFRLQLLPALFVLAAMGLASLAARLSVSRA